jgi:hypothetical protein
VFEERFDAARMARDYVEVYRRLAHQNSEAARSASYAPEPLSLPVGHRTYRISPTARTSLL